MKKAIKTILLTLLIAAFTLALVSCGTTAYWQRQGNDTQDIETDVVEVNGSAKHIIYAAIDSSGNFIASSDTTTTPVAYAVVGYRGDVAELVIPATYTDTNIYTAPSGTDHSLPVTKVLPCPSNGTSYPAYKISQGGHAYTENYSQLQNNTIVKSIVFGSNVNAVASGVCVAMINLESVTFTSASAVALGDSAFGYCVKLQTVTGNYTDANGTAFVGCAYTPPTV